MSLIVPTEDTNVLKLINESFGKPTHNGILGEFSLDPALSDKDTQVYLDKKKNVYVIHRQTDLKNPNTRWKDVNSDIALAFGQEHSNKRFQDAKQKIKEVEMKYPHSTNIYNGGFSLGGAVANYANQGCTSGRCTAISYNKGSTPFSNKGSSNSRNYYIQGDILSNGGVLSSRGSQIVLPSKVHNRHSRDNFSSTVFKKGNNPVNVA